MNYDELKAEAKRLGYRLVKIEPKARLENCPVCGSSNRKIHLWQSAINFGKQFRCDKCEFHSEDWSKSEIAARRAWNDAVSKYKEVAP